MKELNYINTNALWDEMSDIANEAINGIEDVLREADLNIETSFGMLHYDEDEEEVYLKTETDDIPLREEDTSKILTIADEVNDFVDEYNK